jgi:NAD(P)-dependent dehydrogenase (short-subunit alcohol dehydrogenase family)
MRAVITGGASGIGRATAQRLAASGDAEILLVDVSAEGLARAAAEVPGATTAVVDLGSAEAGELVAAAARERFEGLDALISNAGTLNDAPLLDLTLADYERAFAVNTRATWLLGKALHPLLKAAKGSLVATASLAGEQPTPPFGAYSASKAALIMLVKQLAFEWGPDGIRCNCVSPGTVHTPMTDAVYSDPGRRAERASHIPLRRVAGADDIADAIVYLAGPGARYVSGVNLVVDGGLQTTLMPLARALRQS